MFGWCREHCTSCFQARGVGIWKRVSCVNKTFGSSLNGKLRDCHLSCKSSADLPVWSYLYSWVSLKESQDALFWSEHPTRLMLSLPRTLMYVNRVFGGGRGRFLAFGSIIHCCTMLTRLLLLSVRHRLDLTYLMAVFCCFVFSLTSYEVYSLGYHGCLWSSARDVPSVEYK